MGKKGLSTLMIIKDGGLLEKKQSLACGKRLNKLFHVESNIGVDAWQTLHPGHEIRIHVDQKAGIKGVRQTQTFLQS